MSRAYSIWLVPENKERRRWFRIIRKLAKEHGAVPFIPHCTLLFGVTNQQYLGSADSELNKRLRALARVTQSFILTPLSVQTSRNYFRSLFLTIKQNRTLQQTHRRAKEMFAQQHRLQPHMSLLYVNLPIAQKRAIAQHLRVFLRQISMTEVWLVTPNSKSGWRDVEHWHVVAREKMRKR